MQKLSCLDRVHYSHISQLSSNQCHAPKGHQDSFIIIIRGELINKR